MIILPRHACVFDMEEAKRQFAVGISRKLFLEPQVSANMEYFLAVLDDRFLLAKRSLHFLCTSEFGLRWGNSHAKNKAGENVNEELHVMFDW